MKRLKAIDKTTGHVVRARKFLSRTTVPIWSDSYLCEDDYLYFIENLREEKLIKMTTGDYLIKDQDKVYLVKKEDAPQRLKFFRE